MSRFIRRLDRRRFVQSTALFAGAGALTSVLPRRLFAQDKVTAVNSIRSLSNPYHASWNQGGEAFSGWAGADYATLVTEGNSEKGIADIQAMIARTSGNMVLNVDPNESPDARPIVEACADAGVYVTTQWNKPADLHPWDFDPYYVCHISFDGKPNGKAMAEALFKAMGGSGGIVALGGILSNVPAIERKAGLDEALAENPDVELLDFQVANWDPNQAYDITSAWVTRFGDIAEAGDPGAGDVVGLVRVPVRYLEIEQLDVRILGERLVETCLALDSGHVREDAAERHDAARAAHRLEQRLGHGLAVRLAVERDVADVVGIEVPGMQVGGLVPLGGDVDAGVGAGLHDRARVGALVGIDVQDHVAAGPGDHRLDVGDAFLAVALGHQGRVVGAGPPRKRLAALVPAGVVGVGERADRVDRGHLILSEQPPRQDAGERTGAGEQGGRLDETPAIEPTDESAHWHASLSGCDRAAATKCPTVQAQDRTNPAPSRGWKLKLSGACAAENGRCRARTRCPRGRRTRSMPA